MKKKILLFSLLVAILVCAFAICVSAEDNIIKLDKLPTLDEIHANRSAYVSTIDALEVESTYKTTDPDSVVVLSDLAETPTYYVYPCYYFIKSSYYNISGNVSKFNEAIRAADPTAFAGYSSAGADWGYGECDYVIRIEFPKYVTQIAARYKFEGSANVKEIYFPVYTTIDEETGLEKTVPYCASISGENLFGSCPSLEIMHNQEYLPIGLFQGNNAGFTGCSSLKEIYIPEGVTSLSGSFFKGCASLKEITLPNSLVSVGKAAFSGCSSLEKFTFSANFTTFSRVNNDYETFVGCNNLKFVYLPATFANSVQAVPGDYKNIFGQSSKTIYFVTENDYDKIVAIQEKFIANKTSREDPNGNIANADIELYDPNKDYAVYQAGLTKSVIVYGYSACNAFYNNEHIKAEPTYGFKADKYISDFCSFTSCTRCVDITTEELVTPLFTSRGYSTSGDAFMYDVQVNRDAIAEYKDFYMAKFGKEADINYGLVISGDTSIDSLIDAEGETDSNAWKIVFDDVYTKIQIKFNNVLTDAQKELKLHACAYVIEDGAVNYIGDGKTSDKSTVVSYNSILAKTEPEVE